MRLRTHHKRKIRKVKRQSDVTRYLASGKFQQDLELCMTLIIQNLETGMRAILEGFQDTLSKTFLLNSAQLDAEPFWEEWPEIIGE